MRDDLELLTAWRNGDLDACGELFDRHSPAIGRFFRNKVGDDHQELVQRTFTRCVEAQHRFRGEGKFRSYLFSIAVNVLREYLHGRRREARVDGDHPSVADLRLPSPSSVLDARREVKVLLQALRRIPWDDQVVVELFHFEELSSAEIAEVLGIPRPTVRSRLRLARERLRGHIEELARNPAEIESTVDGLDRWAAQLRDQLK